MNLDRTVRIQFVSDSYDHYGNIIISDLPTFFCENGQMYHVTNHLTGLNIILDSIKYS